MIESKIEEARRSLEKAMSVAGELNSSIDALQKRVELLTRSYEIVVEALEKSVKLQSHYAKLLNMHDGGKRMGFENAARWMERLAELEALRREDAATINEVLKDANHE